MANFTKNYETTGGMGGARPLDTYDLDLPLGDGGGAKTNWAELSKNIFNQGFPDQSNVTSTPVLCKDGSTKNQLSGRYSDACMNNGGRADNQLAVKPTTDAVKQQNLNLASRVDVMTQEDKFYEMLGIKKSSSGSIGIQSRPLGRLLVAVVLVAGYFAYKKFKK